MERGRPARKLLKECGRGRPRSILSETTMSNEITFNAIRPADQLTATSLTEKERADLKKAAQEFEAIFIAQLLKVMRETIEESGMEGSGFGKTIYTELFDQEMANDMARRGVIGIGDMIYRNVLEKDAARAASHDIDSSKISEISPARPSVAPAQSSSTIDKDSSNKISDTMLPVHAPISSSFGMRKDPFTGEAKFHKGVDLAAPAGTPVVAALPGKVISAGYESGYGNVVLVEHEDGLRTRYGHLASINVKAGEKVDSENPLGTVGSTGRSTGAHLHFEVIRMGKPVNPMAVLNSSTILYSK